MLFGNGSVAAYEDAISISDSGSSFASIAALSNPQLMRSGDKRARTA